jgi:hypothetical protein
MQDDLNDIFVSKYLKAADLNGKEWPMVIAGATAQIIGEGAKATTKVLITFQGAKKAFVANKTNCNRIAFRHGTKLSGWTGKEIILYPELVDFQGEAVEAIRVKHPVDNANVQQAKARADYLVSGKQPNPAPADPAMDDEIPF